MIKKCVYNSCKTENYEFLQSNIVNSYCLGIDILLIYIYRNVPIDMRESETKTRRKNNKCPVYRQYPYLKKFGPPKFVFYYGLVCTQPDFNP